MTVPAAVEPGHVATRALAALAVLGVALVAVGVLAKLGGFDVPWMLAVHAQPHSPFAIVAWSCLTVLGLGWSALIGVLAADRRSGRLTSALVATLVLAGLLAQVPKHLLRVARPAATDIYPQLHVIGQAFTGAVSMPSGHAVTAGATLGLLWLAVPRVRRWPLGLALALLAALVTISRVFVGAHWPSDVLVGSGLGLLAAVLAAASLAWRPTRRLHEGLAARMRTPLGQVLVGAAEIGLAYGLLHERTGYPAAHPLVLALAAVAAGSALLRWLAVLRGRRAVVQADPAHLERP